MSTLEGKGFGISDLTLLDEVTEEKANENLKLRFEKGKMYTYIGEVIVSVNPYRKLDIYNEECILEYMDKEPYERPPHIYAVAESAYHDMKKYRKGSCILITGESGSGKTENSKVIMQYIASINFHMSEVERVKTLLVKSNPLLEMYGNAKTIRNDNSSRFGKYMDVTFDLGFQPRGGHIKTFMLEKARVVKHQDGERNFHSFYHLLQGAEAQTLQELKLDRDPAKYAYLCPKSEDSPELLERDSQNFQEANDAMKAIGISQDLINATHKLLAAILHLGNIDFNSDEDGSGSVITNLEALANSAHLLNMEPEELKNTLTRRVLASKKEQVYSNLSPSGATYSRDALAKAIYERIFHWIISCINTKASANLPDGMPSTAVSVLDVYGFEIFGLNSFSCHCSDGYSFEQLCINYCNEKLQHLFIELVLSKEQEVYKEEGLDWVKIEYFDNKSICTMIDAPKTGIYAIVDDECIQPGDDGEERCMIHMDKVLSSNSYYGSNAQGRQDLLFHKEFEINHYAGTVKYNIEGFVDKNKDSQFQDLKIAMYNTGVPLLQTLFPEGANPFEVNKNPVSLGTSFKQDVCTLVELLQNQTPHYIRCMMPNHDKSSEIYDVELMTHQMRCLGLLENTQVRRAGYPFRLKYKQFMSRYKLLVPDLWPTYRMSDRKATEHLVEHYHLQKMVKYGKTRLFVRTTMAMYFLEGLRHNKLPEHAITIQRWARGYHWRTTMPKMLALLKIMYWYRRMHVVSWFNRVTEVFEGCALLADKGKCLQWPQHPPALKLGATMLQNVHKNWWALHKIQNLKEDERYEIRLKTIAYSLLRGKKQNCRYDTPWVGDELKVKEKFCREMSAYQSINGDTKRLYSCYIIKLNRKEKPDPRVFALCDHYLYRLDLHSFRLTKKAPISLEDVTGFSISPGNDQALVVHCKPEVGDQVFYLEHGRPAAEFLAAIWYAISRKYGKKLSVTVTSRIVYHHYGNKERVLVCDPGQEPVSV